MKRRAPRHEHRIVLKVDGVKYLSTRIYRTRHAVERIAAHLVHDYGHNVVVYVQRRRIGTDGPWRYVDEHEQ